MISEPRASVSSTSPSSLSFAVRLELGVLEILRADAEDHAASLVVLQAGTGRERLVAECDRLIARSHGEAAVGALELRLDQVHRRAADEAADEEVHGPVVQLLRLGHLLQLALAHHGDAVAHRHRLDLVVRDVDGRRAEVVLELLDLRARLHAQLRVEVGERLVHQERGRLAHDRAAHRDALPLAARERPRLAVEIGLEAEQPRRLLDAPLDLLLVHLLQLQAEADVVVDAQVRVERVALEDHRDVAVA